MILFADTFNRYFDPEVLRAATVILQKAGLKVQTARPLNGGRALDCGRTFLSVGAIDEAKQEVERLIASVLPHVRRGVPVIGLEPASLLGLKDEIPSMLPNADTELVAQNAMLFEEFFVKNPMTRALSFKPLGRNILLHGHCHQKAHDVLQFTQKALALIPDTETTLIESSCCGGAGSFGYGKSTAEISLMMAEQALFPAIRDAGSTSLIVANGFSCRHQITSGLGSNAYHVAEILLMRLSD